MKEGIESSRRTSVVRASSAVIRLCVFVTFSAGTASLCGFLAELAWPFELLCHFRVQYCVLFLVICVTMGVRKRP